jgi:hypothetical protein
MALKPFAESADEIPEGLRDHYAEGDDGKLYLQVEQVGGWALEDVSGLKSTLTKKKAALEKIQKQAESYEGLDPEKAREALAKLDEINSWTPDEKVNEKIRAEVEAVRAKLLKDLDTEKAGRNEVETALSELLIDNQVRSLMGGEALGGEPEIVLPYVRSRTRVVRDENGVRRVQVLREDRQGPVHTKKSGSADEMDLSEFLGELKDHEKWSRAFNGTGASGSGASSSGAFRGSSGLESISDPVERMKEARRRQGGN